MICGDRVDIGLHFLFGRKSFAQFDDTTLFFFVDVTRFFRPASRRREASDRSRDAGTGVLGAAPPTMLRFVFQMDKVQNKEISCR